MSSKAITVQGINIPNNIATSKAGFLGLPCYSWILMSQIHPSLEELTQAKLALAVYKILDEDVDFDLWTKWCRWEVWDED
ncbi:hypothetical protein CORC01_03094 [Colletotrichum orchidophilum]|uniref:Uncharacterized protein n=1 Tax=Colletotrichum orchidophilum TaxID=1209926 RepID=A0A1G4BJK6_9PEZI|nr:uncharacterized protein CORC01_03094 [Colletotrichum orchidophilum]OHF01604.1 hypothetical protein CORC01_03094 [Colletotrichum orchidophilum]